MPLALTPVRSVVQPRGQVLMLATGGTPPYTYSLSQNESGATINSATGAYVAGPKVVRADVVKVTDSAAGTATAPVFVQGGAYQGYQVGLAPPSHQGPGGVPIEQQYGAEKDIQLERAREGILDSMPGYAVPDALDYIGAERLLPRSVAESPSDNGGAKDIAYGERLRTCWDDIHGWSYAGSHASLLFALDRAGFPMGDPAGCHVMQRYKRYSWLTAAGGTPVYGNHPLRWDFDGASPAQWAQFGLIFGADVTDLTVGSDRAKQLNAIVDLWRPRKARFMGTWIIVSGPSWGWPIGVTWGAGGRNWGGGVTRFVPPV